VTFQGRSLQLFHLHVAVCKISTPRDIDAIREADRNPEDRHDQGAQDDLETSEKEVEVAAGGAGFISRRMVLVTLTFPLDWTQSGSQSLVR
jgi:hypothetical protein